MTLYREALMASAVVAIATLAIAAPSPAASKSGIAVSRSDELSAQTDRRHRRQVRRRHAPADSAPRYHQPPDPSFGPDGKLYPVPEHLRGQCYIDEGYGRFSACGFMR
jgi:hypothetical protein